jgi:two-component sensor histidine kinase
MLAIEELAARMADHPEAVLPRFVDLAMEITGAVSAGLSLYEPEPAPGVFRWRFLRGRLAGFENLLSPLDFNSYGGDRKGPVLSRHPERTYSWIAKAGIEAPEVLLVPLYLRGAEPLGELWIIAETEGHFTRSHARAMTELAAFVGIALSMRDTEERLQKALEEQQTLAKEMGHRLKNLFAMTDGMIRATARRAHDKDELAQALSGRIHALASAHALVSRSLSEVGRAPRAGDIGALIRAVVLPHEGAEAVAPPRLTITGPSIRCGDHAINGLALIFHELATNAAKYGALSGEGGGVDIGWRREGELLRFDWTESGGPMVEAPTQKGFGSVLVRNTVAGQFGGEITYDWNPAGVRVAIRVDVARLAL